MLDLSKYKSVLSALVTRGGGMALQFLSTLIIARALDPEGMGVYSVYLGWMLVLSGVVSVGAPTLAMRRVSILHQSNNWAGISQQMISLSILTFVMSVLVLIIFLGVGTPTLVQVTGFELLIYAAIGGALFAAIKLFSEALKAMDYVNTAMLFENILMAFLMLVLVGGLVATDVLPSAVDVVQLNLGILSLVLLILILFFYRRGPFSFDLANINFRDYGHALPPLWGNIMIAMLFLNAPLLIAPLFASEEELGLFGVAYRLVMISVNVLMVLAAFFGPKFSRLYSQNDFEGLRIALWESRKLSLILFLPICLFIFVFPEFTLGLFGSAYVAGKEVLLIMIGGQLVYASTGLVGLFLAMTDHAALELKLAVVGVLVMVVLVSFGGVVAGIQGVAAGFTLALGIKNLLSLYFAKRVILSKA